MDLNFDGKVDVWLYLTSSGEAERREFDYDQDGQIDEVVRYERGQIVSKERAAAHAGKIDTWQFYQGNRLTRAERDINGDGQIDEWWEYPRADHLECPIVHSDVDGDGRPDPRATLDLCPPINPGEAAPPAASQLPASSAPSVPTAASTASAASPSSGTSDAAQTPALSGSALPSAAAPKASGSALPGAAAPKAEAKPKAGVNTP
jgi:hypothetical protein